MAHRTTAQAAKRAASDLSQEETPDRLEVVLDAAAACFMARGYDSTTVDNIAAALGATKGRIYYNFETKADIFFSVYARALQKCLGYIGHLINAELAPRVKLARMMQAHILGLMDALPYHIVANMGVEIYLREGALTPRQRHTMESLIAQRDAYEEIFRKVIKEGIAADEFFVADLWIATRTLLASINAVSVWYRPRSDQGSSARVAIADAVVDTLLHGILRPRTLPARKSK